MRADRLIAVLLFLQRRGHVTAAEVAQELEVSERTARRDLEALAMSGVPLYSKHGRGGGWTLVGGASTDLSGLSSDEARAVFLAIGSSASGSPELQSAARKLTGAIPEPFRDEAEAASTAVKVDPTGWSAINRTEPDLHRERLTQAVVDGRKASIVYASPQTGERRRVVHPLGLVTKRGVWYLVANTRRGIRTFRLSRVQAVRVLDEPVSRPEDFDLDVVWESIVTKVTANEPESTVRVVTTGVEARVLIRAFAGQIEIHDQSAGEIEATLYEFSDEVLARKLLSFGASVRLVEPSTELLGELRRLTEELRDTYL